MSTPKESQQPVASALIGPQDYERHVLAGAKSALSSSQFDATRPFVLQLYIPYAAADRLSDMVEQTEGDRYWIQGQAWSWRWGEATRYSADSAARERNRMLDHGRLDVKVVNANAMVARLEAVAAVRQEMDGKTPRAAFLAAVQEVRDLPLELFADAISAVSANESPSLDHLIAETQRKKREREMLADTLLKDRASDQSVEFTRADGEKAMVGPDVSKPGRFRLTRFDGSGPVGHAEAPTMRDAVLLALKEAYRPAETADQLVKNNGSNPMSQSDRPTKFLAVHSNMSIETGVPLDSMARIAQAFAAHGMKSMADLNGLDVFILDRSLTGAVNEAHSRSIALPKLNAFAVEHGADLRVTDAAGKAWRIDEGVSGYEAEAVAGDVARPRMRI